MSSTELQEAQAHRVQQLTVYLTALLRRYVEGDTEGFKVCRLACDLVALRCNYCSHPVVCLMLH